MRIIGVRVIRFERIWCDQLPKIAEVGRKEYDKAYGASKLAIRNAQKNAWYQKNRERIIKQAVENKRKQKRRAREQPTCELANVL